MNYPAQGQLQNVSSLGVQKAQPFVIPVVTGGGGNITYSTYGTPLFAYDANQETGYTNGANVPTITDLSGNSLNMTQATSANQPTFVSSSSPNGAPAYSFNGSTAIVQSAATTFTATSNFEMIYALKLTAVSGNPCTIMDGAAGSDLGLRFSYGNSSGYASSSSFTGEYKDSGNFNCSVASTSTTLLNHWVILDFVFIVNGTNLLYVNGTSAGTASSAFYNNAFGTSQIYALGAGLSTSFYKNYATVLINKAILYNAQLTSGNRTSLYNAIYAQVGTN